MELQRQADALATRCEARKPATPFVELKPMSLTLPNWTHRVMSVAQSAATSTSTAWSCRTVDTESDSLSVQAGTSVSDSSEQSYTITLIETASFTNSDAGSDTLLVMASAHSNRQTPSILDIPPPLPLARLQELHHGESDPEDIQQKDIHRYGSPLGCQSPGSQCRDRFLNALARSKALNYARHEPQHKIAGDAVHCAFTHPAAGHLALMVDTAHEFQSSHWRKRAVDLTLIVSEMLKEMRQCKSLAVALQTQIHQAAHEKQAGDVSLARQLVHLAASVNTAVAAFRGEMEQEAYQKQAQTSKVLEKTRHNSSLRCQLKHLRAAHDSLRADLALAKSIAAEAGAKSKKLAQTADVARDRSRRAMAEAAATRAACGLESTRVLSLKEQLARAQREHVRTCQDLGGLKLAHAASSTSTCTSPIIMSLSTAISTSALRRRAFRSWVVWWRELARARGERRIVCLVFSRAFRLLRAIVRRWQSATDSRCNPLLASLVMRAWREAVLQRQAAIGLGVAAGLQRMHRYTLASAYLQRWRDASAARAIGHSRDKLDDLLYRAAETMEGKCEETRVLTHQLEHLRNLLFFKRRKNAARRVLSLALACWHTRAHEKGMRRKTLKCTALRWRRHKGRQSKTHAIRAWAREAWESAEEGWRRRSWYLQSLAAFYDL
jgi:hypothetical protein